MLWNNPCIYFLVPLVARATIFGASVGDAIAIGALSAFYGFFLYLNSIKIEPLNEKVQNDVAEMKTQISGLKLALAQRR